MCVCVLKDHRRKVSLKDPLPSVSCLQDSQIATLEREIQTLEDKLFKSKEDFGLDDRRDSPGIKDKQLRFEVIFLGEKLIMGMDVGNCMICSVESTLC